MINNKQHNINKNGHRIFFILILCLFGFCLVQAMQAPRKKHKKRPEERESIFFTPMSCAMICLAETLMPRS